jgi:hypothetical protein
MSRPAICAPRAKFGTAYAVVRELFFDLALARKIDNDTETIHIIDRPPTGNATLDRVLAGMDGQTTLTTVREWIEEMFLRPTTWG